MKTAFLLSVHLICAVILTMAACSGGSKSKLKGSWHSKDGATSIRITSAKFTMDNDPPEEYFMKGDTILTSFEGNQPYTRFVIQKLDDHNLKLLYPDSVSIEFQR